MTREPDYQINVTSDRDFSALGLMRINRAVSFCGSQNPRPETREKMLPETLKNATVDQHEAVEAGLDLMAPGLTVCAYIHRLERFFGFYRAWERAACAAGAINSPVGAAVRPGVRTGRLRADLRCFGRTDAAIDALPDCTALPPLDSADRVTGSAYVLEGAALGGRLIARHLEETLDLHAGKGYSFFSGDGDDTGARWQAFRRVLNAYEPACEAAVIESARATFRAFGAWNSLSTVAGMS